MCRGGENPGAISDSTRPNAPPVLSAVALIVIRFLRNQIACPSPGSSSRAFSAVFVVGVTGSLTMATSELNYTIVQLRHYDILLAHGCQTAHEWRRRRDSTHTATGTATPHAEGNR